MIIPLCQRIRYGANLGEGLEKRAGIPTGLKDRTWSGAGGGGRCQPRHGHPQRRGLPEAAPRRSDFSKATASDMPGPGTLPAPSRQKAGAHHNAGRCRVPQTPRTSGLSLCSLPGEPLAGQTDGRSPAPAPRRSRAQQDGMRWDASGFFFSLDSSTYFANDPFTPNYTAVGSNAL